jgi:pilus assembly protein Flp/PilA
MCKALLCFILSTKNFYGSDYNYNISLLSIYMERLIMYILKKRPRQKGQGLVEYALVLVLIAVIVILILAVTGQSVATKMCDVVIQLGATVPDSVQQCRAPRILAGGNMTSNPINIEVTLRNNHGPMKSGVDVYFSIDGNLVETEHSWPYCLGGDPNDGVTDRCYNYGATLSPGAHKLHITATDSQGNTGDFDTTLNIN